MVGVPSFPFTQKSLGTVIVAATAKATPTTIYTVDKRERRVRLYRLTVANIAANGTSEQVWVGVRKEADSGATWNPFWSVYCDGGIPQDPWEGGILMTAGDELVAYAGTTNLFHITPEVETAE